VIRDNVDELIKILKKHNYEKEYYLSVRAENPKDFAKKFWMKLSAGGQISEPRPGVFISKFQGNSLVVYRPKSSVKGSPVVEIKFTESHGNVHPDHKIHFIQKSKGGKK
jgi:hypothetical protein